MSQRIPGLPGQINRWSRRQFLRKAVLLSTGAAAGILSSQIRAETTLDPTTGRMPDPRLPGEPLAQSAGDGAGLILGPGRAPGQRGAPTAHFISIIDLDSLSDEGYALARLPMDFFGHGIVPDPVNPERATVFQKKGPGACEVDLKNLAVIRPIRTADSQRFYGHGAYSPDGSLLFATETQSDSESTGLISVRDAATHANLSQFPSFGSSPHDCRLIDNGQTLCITNGGGPMGGDPPSVTYVDVASEKLIEKLELASPTLRAGHLALTTQGDLAVASAQREGLDPYTSNGGISLRPASGELRLMQQPAEVTDRMLGETLSICIHEPSGVVAATNPLGNIVTFWAMATGSLLRYYTARSPRGLTLTADEKFFVLSYGKPSQISLIRTDTLDKANDLDLSKTGMTGSHIINHSLTERHS